MADEVTREQLIFELKIDRGASEKEIDDLTESIEETRKETEKLVQANKDLKKAGQENSREFKENAKTIEINKDSINRNNTARKNIINAIKAEDNSLGALKAKLAEEKRARDQVNLSTEQGRKRFDELTASIKKNTDALLHAEKAGGQYSRQVGNYNLLSKEAVTNSGQFGQQTVGLIENFKNLVNPITATIAAGTGLVAMYMKSAEGARDLNRAQNVLTATFDEFVNRLGNSVNGGWLEKAAKAWSTFTIAVTSNTNVERDAREEAVAIAKIELDTLRDLEIEMITAAGNRKKREKEAEDLRRVRDDQEKTFQERLAASDKIEQALTSTQDERAKVIQRQINALRSYGENVGQIINGEIKDHELKKQILQREAEIADIQEEINGKLTENITARRGIMKEEEDFLNEKAEERKQKEVDASNARIEALRAEHAARLLEIERQLQAEAELRDQYEGDTQAKKQAWHDKQIENINDEMLKEFEKTKGVSDKEAEALADSITGYKKSQDIKAAQRKREVEGMQATADAAGNFARAAFKDAKQAAIATAIINTIGGVVRALVDYAYPYNLIVGALIAGTGALEIDKIRSQEFALGGDASYDTGRHIKVGGRDHTNGGTWYWGQDGNRFNVQKGEGIYVMKREAESAIGSLSDHNQKYGGNSWTNGGSGWYKEQGGLVAMNNAANDSINRADMRYAVRDALSSMPHPIVIVEDISAGLNRRHETQSQAQVL